MYVGNSNIGKDDKLGRADRGWIKQEQNQIKRGKRKSMLSVVLIKKY